MPKIVVDSDKLAKRGRSFNNLLSPLLKDTIRGVAADRWPLPNSSYAIAAYDGSRTYNFNEARFRTFATNFLAQYFEIWSPIDTKKLEQWYLHRAYLNIYNNSTEFFCLHCDPEEDDLAGNKACYKQSPHFHIKIKGHPISKSHIAIAHGYLDRVYKSDEDFFTAFNHGIEIIRDEVLERYQV